MNEIQKTSLKTPIEVVLAIDEDGYTTASAVYEWLELRPSNFARWCNKNILQNDFAEENTDYLRLFIQDETPTGGKIERIDYRITASFAKKLCMASHSERGEIAREYFVRTEHLLKVGTNMAIKEYDNKLITLENNQHRLEVELSYLQCGAMDYKPSDWYYEIWDHLKYYQELQDNEFGRHDDLSKLIGKVISNAKISDQITYMKQRLVEDYEISDPKKIGVIQVIDYERSLRTKFQDALQRMINGMDGPDYIIKEVHTWMDDYLPIERW